MAILDLDSGDLTFTGGVTESNDLTVAFQAGGYSFDDSATPITLGSGALAAGWNGSGTSTVTGPAAAVTGTITITVGGGPSVVNLRSLANPTTVQGGTAQAVINLSSNAPYDTGNLHGLAAPVTVHAGSNTTLVVAEVSVSTGHGDVVIDAEGIRGFAPNLIRWSGDFTRIVVRGSNSSSQAESFTLDGPPSAAFNLSTYAGSDTVTISGDTTGDIYLGSASDTLTVLAGATLDGNVHTKPGDVVLYGPPDYGTITGTVGP